MKKKLSIVLAIVMIFALTVPVMANPFTDVPAGHWAYDAIQEASEAGIITGFEDGTFKGNEAMTRYQMAVLTARMMSQLEDEEVVKELSEKQKEELNKAVNSLNEEFNKELANIDERLTALEDKGLNVKVAGEATTTFTDTTIEGTIDTGAVGVEEGQYWDDWDDTLDDDAPAQKEFKQELDFDIQTIVDEDTTVSLTLDTIADSFADGVDWEGTATNEDQNINLDDALLAINNSNFGVRVGDFGDYHLTDYFYDDEDVEGLEVTANHFGTDVLVFRGQEDENGKEVKGVKVTKDIAGVDLAGEYLKTDAEGIYGVTAETDLVAGIDSKVKYLAKDNSQEDNYLVDGEASTEFAGINMTAGYKQVGTNFEVVNAFKADSDVYGAGEDYEAGIEGYRVKGDMDVLPSLNVFANVEDEELATDNILTTEAGAKYALAANTDVSASYEVVDSDDDADDVDTIKAGLEGKYLDGKLATAASYELEEAAEKTNTFDLRNKYAFSDAVALTADVQYETKENADTARTYYAVGADHKLTENTSLGVNYRVIDFNDNMSAANDYKAESVTGEFKINF
jgi:hypothetical protein